MDTFILIKTVMVIIILILGTTGNVLVVLVVSRRQKMRTVTNYFILNLAVADLTVLISNIPVDVTTQFMGKWIFGKAACKIIKPLQTMGTIASILTLVAISLSRYHAIVYPFRRQMKLRHARVIIVLIWAISLAGITPYSLASKYKEKDEECYEDFASIGMSPSSYTLTLFVLQYVIPMTGMTYAYIRIGAELNNQKYSERGLLMDAEYRRESRKVIKMLCIVVAVFAILDLPVHVVWIWHDFFNGAKEAAYKIIAGIAIIMLYGNSVTNPIIYSVCNEQFRTGFRNLFGKCLLSCCRVAKLLEGDAMNSERENKSRSSVNANLVRAEHGVNNNKREANVVNEIPGNTANIIDNNGYTVSLSAKCENIRRESAV